MLKSGLKLLESELLESAHKSLDYRTGQSAEDFTNNSKAADAA